METSKLKKAAAKTTAAASASSSLPAKDEAALALEKQLGKSPERITAEASHSSFFVNAGTSREFSVERMQEQIDLVEVGIVLREKIKQVQAGDLSEVEAILMGQATTLDTIFNTLARRAAANLGQSSSAADVCLKNAFKAQAQCRATLQTLAEIKNPRQLAFVKQANIAHGHQQINNEIPVAQAPHARTREEKQIQANEQLEMHHGKRLDTGTESASVGIDSHLETLAEIDRTAL